VGDELDGQASRAPTPDDLSRLCKALNEAGAKYVLVGGLAVNYWGRQRATEDVDFLVDPSPDNVRRIKRGMEVLADNAARDVRDGDVAECTVVRVVDEITVDLMARIGEIEFSNADAVMADVNGVVIPIAALTTLIETKRGMRPQDQTDLRFLLRRQEQRDVPR